MSVTRRGVVRDTVAEVLRAGVPRVDGRVFRGRSWPMHVSQHPALLVYGYDEEKKRTNMTRGEASYDVSCIMTVDARSVGRSRDGEFVEAEIEALAEEICRAVMTAPSLLRSPAGGGLDVSVLSVRTTMKISTEGELAAGDATIAFEIGWQEQYGLPDPPDLCDEHALAFGPAAVTSP